MADLEMREAAATLSNLEYQTFITWYKSVYGENALLPPNDKNIRNIASYKLWAYYGRPGHEKAVKKAVPELTSAEAQAKYYPPELPPPTEKPTPEKPEVISSGGYDWRAIYNPETGEFGDWERIGRTTMEPQEGLTDYQRWQMLQSQREFEFGQQQALEQRAQRQQELQLKSQVDERSRLFSEFEEMRERTLSDLATPGMAPRNWIKRFFMERMENPYSPPTLQERAEVAWLKLADARGQQQGEPSYLRGDAPGTEVLSPTEYTDLLDQQKIAQEAEATGYATVAPKQPAYPEIPAELLPFVQGAKQGTRLSPQAQLTTPSAQSWGRQSWRTRQMYAGLADWLPPYDYINILEQMGKSLPEEPRGVGSKRWLPVRQWG